MSKNEHTSGQIASFASEIERMEQPVFMTPELWKKIKALAGSALTQAPDKPTLLSTYKRIVPDYMGRAGNLKDIAKGIHEGFEKS
jgi:hypothetical protein